MWISGLKGFNNGGSTVHLQILGQLQNLGKDQMKSTSAFLSLSFSELQYGLCRIKSNPISVVYEQQSLE